MTDVTLEGAAMALSYAKMTDIGGRKSNQDSFDTAVQNNLICFIVADGAGGHEGGEVASKIVVETVMDGFAREPVFASQSVLGYIASAVNKVNAAQTTQAELKSMSTTVAVTLIDLVNSEVLWAHIGDTRIYLFRRGKMQYVTKDHSMAQQFVDAGFLAYENIRSNQQRNRLFAAIGAEDAIEPDITTNAVKILDGDVFLMCTDGFWEWITETEMEQMLVQSTSPQDWLDFMCRAAGKNSSESKKSRDNSTAFAIWLGEPELVTIAL